MEELPEKWSEDFKDENGEPVSKKYVCLASHECSCDLGDAENPADGCLRCSEFKKRQKAAKTAAEKAVKQV